MEAIAQPLAEEIEADDGRADGQDRAEERPEGDADVLLRFVDHDPPVRVRWLGAEAEIAERGPAHQGEADVDAALHDDGGPHAGENLAVLNVQPALPAGASRGDVVVARGVEHGAPHDADELRRGGDPEGEHRLHQTRAESDDDEQGEDEGGDGEERVDLRRGVRAVREPDERDGEGKHGQACAELEIAIDSRQSWDGGGDELVHGRAMRGLSAAWARSARRLATT